MGVLRLLALLRSLRGFKAHGSSELTRLQSCSRWCFVTLQRLYMVFGSSNAYIDSAYEYMVHI